MTKENLFFDLDGTIINSGAGVKNSVKYAISNLNLKNLSEEILDTFIGPPLHKSFMKHFEADLETANLYVSKYREYYSVKGILECELYPGIPEMLQSLSKMYNLFITTSKPTHYSLKILDTLKISKYFKDISGSPENGPDSSKCDVVNHIINKYNLDKSKCILIGDTKYDGEGANISGIDFLGITYGFGSKEELQRYNPLKILNSADEIRRYFENGN